MKSISPVRVFLSSLCVSTALCSVIPAAWGMDDDNKDHFFLTLNKEKQEHQDHKENQEKNRKKSFHKLTGRSLTIELLGEETRFYEEEVPYDGDCGYSALNISRQAATELLLQNIHREDIQTLIAPEIYDMLPQLPETHPVLQLQAYQRLAQQNDLDRPYQEQVTSLNDLLNRTKEDGRDGDQLWGYCQQNLNSIQQNPLQNQSYLTFKSLREKIKQNEEERMQFCSQKETIECYIKNFMQIPVHTYFNQYEDNNWLNYSPILMQDQKHRTHAINAIAQLLGKNLIIFDEEGNIKHHYLSSEAPMGKDNTLLLRHIGNHHFNRLIFLEKNEEVEYLDFLRPKPILKEEIQDNSHEKGAQLFPSPILDFINCPVILDEGMKDLQKRLINIGNSYNKLTSLKKALLQWINTPEKGENQNQIKEQLKKLIPLLLPPEELVITSEKGSLGMILEAFYHSKRKTEKDVLIHSAFGAINDRIERCENFASRVEIYSKENSLVLREIKAIYEMYRQGFLLFNIQDEYSLRLMSKDPSLEEMKKIEPGELGIFCKDGGLYCKTTEQENILQIIKSDDPKVGLHPDIFEKFLSASQKIDSNDKKALLQYTLLKGYTLQDLENEYKKYLASKAELYGTLLSSPSLIQQSIAYQLVSRTLFNKVDKQNKEGTHAVRSFEGMHFKVYDYDSELGLCPGKELAMYHLYQLLIGEGVAPSTLVCIGELPFVDLEKAGIKKQVNQALSEGKDIGDLILENPNILHQIEGNKTKALYPIQVSATIEGMGFHTFLENHFFAEWKKKNLNQDPKAYLLEDHGGNSFRLGFQHRFAEFIIPKTIKDKGSKNIKEQKWNKFLQTFNPDDWSLEHIDEDSFARMTLMSFLTDPGDSKADNFMIYRKSKKENNQKWHIISIDTDRVFEPNLHEIESGTKKGHHKVHHKSLFYTLPFFMKEKSLSQKIKNEFKVMNVPLILAKWLLTLRDGNKAYAALQQESALPEKVYTSMKLPVTFKKGQVLTLLRRLQDLQNIVTHHDFNLTLDRTFELMHPVLYAYYEKLYHLYPDDPLARIYEDNTRENNQELTVESVLTEEGLSQKDEEGRSFKDLLQEFNEIEGSTQNSKTLEKNHQTIDEALDEFSQQIKQQGKKETLLDLILEARDADLFKRLINAQGLQAVNPSLGRRFYHSVIKKNQGDLELKKAWELLVNHPHNAKLHWYMGLDHLFLSPQEAKHKITSATEGEKYLPQEVWDQLINEKNEFKRQNQDGAHAVGKATHNGYTLYFKFLPKLPGLEEAVGRWTRNLIGFGAPHVELFRLDDYPVLVSQEIKGLTLKETIQKHPERLSQLDPKSLSQILFTTMLINPEDGKPDNYIVEQLSDNPPLYRLIGVDNDQALVPAVAKEQKKGWGKSLSVVQVKCILYCLDQMDRPIDQETKEYFKNLDPQLLLSTWLNELDLVHQRQVELFANTESNNALLTKLFKELDSYVGVPFKRGDLHEFYDRFLRLQKALHDPEVKTYHDLLMRVEPRLGKRYGELRHNPNKYPKDLYEKFKVIDGKYFSETMGTLTSGKDTLGGKGISEKEVLEDIIKRDRHYTPKLALKELERRVDEMAKMEISSLLQAQEGDIEAFASEEFRNKFFQNTDFTHAKLDPEGKTYGPVSINTQQKLLTGLEPYELHALTLTNCQALTYPVVQKFKIQDLTHVSLVGCSGVTSSVTAHCLALSLNNVRGLSTWISVDHSILLMWRAEHFFPLRFLFQI